MARALAQEKAFREAQASSLSWFARLLAMLHVERVVAAAHGAGKTAISVLESLSAMEAHALGCWR